jgi:hypothetical protein
MESLRNLPKEKREVVLNLAVAEFGTKRPRKQKSKQEYMAGAELPAEGAEQKPRKGRKKKAAE